MTIQNTKLPNDIHQRVFLAAVAPYALRLRDQSYQMMLSTTGLQQSRLRDRKPGVTIQALRLVYIGRITIVIEHGVA